MVGMAVWGTRRPWMTAEYVTIKFNNEVCLEGSQSDSSISTIHFGVKRHNFKDVMEGLSFSMCKKLVQGNIWMSSNAQGHVQVMTLILRFQKQSSFRKHMFEYRNPLEQPISVTMFRSFCVVLADDNNKKTLNDVIDW
ncbi:protein EIN4-like [Solanum tuberosum]|uniref:protein EIN4-like n=1 Tax=Solanum tuberosum TaxID=4113 RepID=UPI0003D2907C|nr:PREDICTED: protein EIN4-like [Solanum tuberosum]